MSSDALEDPMQAEPQRRRRFRRQDDQPVVADEAPPLNALLAEIILLREENARLKASEHELPGLGSLLRRARSLPATLTVDEDRGDEAAHVLAEAMVLRESLLGACQEIIGSLQAVEAKLRVLGPHAP
jgi:hypothetical protein